MVFTLWLPRILYFGCNRRELLESCANNSGGSYSGYHSSFANLKTFPFRPLSPFLVPPSFKPDPPQSGAWRWGIRWGRLSADPYGRCVDRIRAGVRRGYDLPTENPPERLVQSKVVNTGASQILCGLRYCGLNHEQADTGHKNYPSGIGKCHLSAEVIAIQLHHRPSPD